VTTTTVPVKTTTEEESSGWEPETTTPQAPVTTTTVPVKTTTEEENSGWEPETTTPQAPVTTTTVPVKTTTEEESSGWEPETTTPQAPVTTTTVPVKTTTEEESSGWEPQTTTPQAPVTTTTAEIKTTTPSCYWTNWLNTDKPKLPYRDDNETYAHIRANGGAICENPSEIECRPMGGSADDFPKYQEWQVVSCDVNSGLLCRGVDQTTHPICENYEIRVYCCDSSDALVDPALDEVHQIQTQVQDIIDGIESGDESKVGDGLLAELIRAKRNETITEHKIADLVGSLNQESISDGSLDEQIQAQHQVQTQIQNLNSEVKEEAEAHHEFESDVKEQFNGISESIEDVEVPEELENAINTMITDFKNTAKHSVVAEEHEEQQIKTAMKNLVSKEAAADDEIKVLMDKTVENLNELEKNHENLLTENKDLLGSLEHFDEE